MRVPSLSLLIPCVTVFHRSCVLALITASGFSYVQNTTYYTTRDAEVCTPSLNRSNVFLDLTIEGTVTVDASVPQHTLNATLVLARTTLTVHAHTAKEGQALIDVLNQECPCHVRNASAKWVLGETRVVVDQDCRSPFPDTVRAASSAQTRMHAPVFVCGCVSMCARACISEVSNLTLLHPSVLALLGHVQRTGSHCLQLDSLCLRSLALQRHHHEAILHSSGCIPDPLPRSKWCGLRELGGRERDSELEHASMQRFRACKVAHVVALLH